MVTKRALFTPGRTDVQSAKRYRSVSSASVTRAIRNAAETKWYNNDFEFEGAGSGSVTGLNVNVANIGSGGGASQRIGNKILLTALELHIAATMPAGDHTHLRVVLYCPKDPSTEITINALTPKVGINNGQFWVLHDMWYAPADGALSVNIMKKLNQRVEFDGSSTLAFTRNPLKALIVGEGGTSINFSFAGTSKVWFKDI